MASVCIQHVQVEQTGDGPALLQRDHAPLQAGGVPAVDGKAALAAAPGMDLLGADDAGPHALQVPVHHPACFGICLLGQGELLERTGNIEGQRDERPPVPSQQALLPVLPFFPGPEDFFQKGGLGDVCAVRLHGHLLLSGSPEPSP